MSKDKEFLCFNNEINNENISLLNQKSYYSFFNINQDFITPKIEEDFKFIYLNEKNYENKQKKIIFIEQELTPEVIQSKNILFEIFKNLCIKFIDNPIKELSFIGLNTFMSRIYIPSKLSEDNLNVYKSLKFIQKWDIIMAFHYLK